MVVSVVFTTLPAQAGQGQVREEVPPWVLQQLSLRGQRIQETSRNSWGDLPCRHHDLLTLGMKRQCDQAEKRENKQGGFMSGWIKVNSRCSSHVGRFHFTDRQRPRPQRHRPHYHRRFLQHCLRLRHYCFLQQFHHS